MFVSETSKLKAPLHCEMFRAICLAMFWRLVAGHASCTKISQCNIPATAKTLRDKSHKPLPKVNTFRELVSRSILAVAGYVTL